MRLVGALVAALCASASIASQPPARRMHVAAGYRVFAESYSKILCEIPAKWRVETFPKAKTTGEHLLFVVANGKDIRLSVTRYNGKHPELSTIERFLEAQAKGAAVKTIAIGPNRRVARSFETKTIDRHERVVVVPAAIKPRFYVIRYSAPPGDFLRYHRDFEHLLDTFLLRTGRTTGI